MKARWMVVQWQTRTGRMITCIERALTMPEMVTAPSVLPALQGKRDAWVAFVPYDIEKGIMLDKCVLSMAASGTMLDKCVLSMAASGIMLDKCVLSMAT